jgi:peptidoglycan/LPS O-acetylase OafA/YrhL
VPDPVKLLRERRPALAELPARAVRVDIQGLRAIAVLLVVGFHLYADRLPGGFIGVDVFLVVSGFLITSHLLRSPPRHAGDFAEFWGRRIRRLLPASLLVIVTTVVVGCILLPASQLAALSRDALASVLYVENWSLAAEAVDYLDADAAPSPLQHYWSLGVEEQFYLLWPFLIALVGVIGARRGTLTGPAWWVLGSFVGISLVISVAWTALEPASAYFVTPTRLWELGVGGLVAGAARTAVGSTRTGLLGTGARSAASWAGLIVIGVSAFTLNGESGFPGAIALLPVGGAALFLAADSNEGRFSPSRILAWRPIQFVGDTSYSIYLWHFPLIILVAAALDQPRNTIWNAGIVVACLVLAGLTKILVEDPVRTSVWLRRPQWRTYLTAAIATVLAIGISFIPLARPTAIAAEAVAVREKVIAANGSCLGAAALVTEGCDVHGVGVIPAPATARQEDISTAYADDCFNDKPFADDKSCTYGDPATAAGSIALVGNSHAVEWLPALQELATKRDLAITLFVASGCMPTAAHVVFDTQASSDGCHSWGQRVVERTASDEFDVVVTAVASTSDIVGVAPEDKFEPQAEGYAWALGQWAQAGVPVLLIRDTPFPGFSIPDCVAGNLDDVSACDGDRAVWERPDPMLEAAEQVDSDLVRVLDLNDHFCDESMCYAVIGGVLAYFDKEHVGATFSVSAAPYIAGALDEVLELADTPGS